MATTARPKGNKLLVRPDEPETRSKGGLYLPPSAQERPTEGVVIAVGQGHLDIATGRRIPLDFNVGDRVLYAKYGAVDLTLDGIPHVVVDEDQVLVALEGEEDVPADDPEAAVAPMRGPDAYSPSMSAPWREEDGVSVTPIQPAPDPIILFAPGTETTYAMLETYFGPIDYMDGVGGGDWQANLVDPHTGTAYVVQARDDGMGDGCTVVSIEALPRPGESRPEDPYEIESAQVVVDGKDTPLIRRDDGEYLADRCL